MMVPIVGCRGVVQVWGLFLEGRKCDKPGLVNLENVVNLLTEVPVGFMY